MGNNAINKQFKMNQGVHASTDTATTFRDPEGVAQAGGTTLNMGHPMNYGTMAPTNMGHSPANMGHSPINSNGPGRKPGETREEYGERVLKEAKERERKRQESKKKGNKSTGRSDDFSFGPISGNLNRYGQGG